eukprot:CAMPEP_0118679236 /NCGR_PEP_ID=MMETSP0800-20121206/3679_1 /TAXON_ID=210618 ORGANISM="Striatella unipunctata, Strain CCMP2910" /NCGR_SAMPLE_ID=MMETSP0800 /ASSEMBLY_ACC=CAM_ASM_000638 /LENGTH=471 /DNA_ID=CAMNT_0006575215 /DNA_START=121 /DNA_END=1536 /DNA_ORIENTATION=+
MTLMLLRTTLKRQDSGSSKLTDVTQDFAQEWISMGAAPPPKANTTSFGLARLASRRNTTRIPRPKYRRSSTMPQWKSAVDPKSGRTYYYDAITRETQWRKPLELASPQEREATQKKEQKQKDFFAAMEANILKNISDGIVPASPFCETPTLEPKKPALTRTISSMPEDLLCNDDQATRAMDQVRRVADEMSRLSIARPAVPSSNLERPQMRKRNTCGTVYVGSTMSTPDKDATIKCVCGVYRAHVLQSSRDGGPLWSKSELIFSDHAKLRSTSIREDRVQDGSGEAVAVPSLEEMCAFFRFVFFKAQMETDCIIMSLIYVERLIKTGRVRPRSTNWRSLLFSCMILSSKVWDDLSMWNVDFSQACPPGVVFSLERINKLELAILECLGYDVKVLASEYAKYYFVLRTMCITSGLAGQDISSPLDVEGAKRLESLSANFKLKSTVLTPARRVKSLTTDSSGTKASLEHIVPM